MELLRRAPQPQRRASGGRPPARRPLPRRLAGRRALKDRIRHVVCSEGTDLFATALFEREVSVWSFAQRRLLARFDTVLDYGGHRLALVERPEPVLIAGAYERHGIHGYDALTGEARWARRDIKKLQRLSFGHDVAEVLAGLQVGRSRWLDVATGADRPGPFGVDHIVPGPLADDEVHLYGRDNSLRLWDRARGRYRWRSYAEKIGPRIVAASERGIFFADGAVLREVAPGRRVELQWELEDDILVDAAAWYPARRWWLVVSRTERMTAVTAIDPIAGDEVNSVELGNVEEVDFMPGGALLVASDGTVRDATDGEIVWRYAVTG